MKKHISYFSPVMLFIALTFMPIITLQAQGIGSPTINVWYGDSQEFGNHGEPQTWCNIQGNVTDDGTINSFSYSLNGGSLINLSIGPDNRRLLNSGDFNIDLDVTHLLPGSNTVVISAIDNDLNISNKTVTINYSDGNTWPIPYSIDWSTLNIDLTDINDVAHVVDGKFIRTPIGIQTAEPGYDRLIALGDMTSTNYEVLVPITIHNMPSDGGVGVLLRWKGHTDNPVVCPQPKCGYLPLGAISWFRSNRLEFYQGNNVSFTPSIGVTYMFRTSVETDAVSGDTHYRIKYWIQGDVEPIAWNLERTNDSSDEQEGSLMLISHKADVTFGNVIVTPGSLLISNVETQLSNNNTEGTITWTTNQPTTSRVDYGPTIAYENGFVENTTLVTSHSITLTGLTSDSIYQYKISGENSVPESVEKTGLVLSTFTSGIISDDFCDNSLNPVWTFDNPNNGGSLALTSSGTSEAYLEISVPGGSEHQNYTSGINSPNLMQPMNNSDFEVEVKFESGVNTPQYQQQGILVKESNNRFLRFEFYAKEVNNVNKTFIYAQSFNLPVAQTAYVNSDIALEGIAPLHMKVKREGNLWTMSYSLNGTDFTVGTTFTNDLIPSQIGPFAGNAVGNTSPAHTAKIDYFENLEDPIITEDSCNVQQSPVLASIGNKSVEEGSSLPIMLSATDGDGNDFDIDFSVIGLPTFGLLTDNNDGTAVLDINPQIGDQGTYTVNITVTDIDGLTDNEEFDIVVTSVNTGVSNLVSDDYCDNSLNPIWTFIDPLNDASLAFTGSGTGDAFLEITVPAGVEHQLWKINGIQAPHVMQTSNDTDFELEVKMESPVNAPQYQQQGLLIKQDDYNFLRFEISSDNTMTKVLSAILEGTNTFPLTATIPYNLNIGILNTSPIYMRVKREGDLWTHSYSFDDITWTVAGTFSHSMVVNGVGLFAGNAGSNPVHTAQFDYFENIADPINGEDGCIIQQPPVLASIGNQSVEEGSSLPLSLTATDADGNDIDIDFTATGLPVFASLTDNNDGTASLDINPQVGDIGTYTMTITVTDTDGLTDNEEFDIMVTSENTSVSNIVSDDFCENVLNPVWTFIDPLDDANLVFTGSGTDDAFLEITVPAGTEHQLWQSGIQVPHIIQSSNDTDFELMIKMESSVNSPQYQEQGILIKQDDYNFLRFEIYSSNSNTKILSAILEGVNTFPLTASLPVNSDIGTLDVAPIYMRIKREGNLWTQSYSFDGVSWIVAGSFSHLLNVNGVGLYSGNATSSNSPTHSAQFDYFINLEDPILNEDDCEICVGADESLVATWNGSISSDWNDANNWTPNVVPSDCIKIIISATSNPPTISGSLYVKDLVLNSGVSLIIPIRSALSISGDLDMLSESSTYSGLIVKGRVSVSGKIRYHRYTNSQLNRKDLISPPLSGQSWTNFLTTDGHYNADILYSDGADLPFTNYLFGPFEKGVTNDYVVYNYNDPETLDPSKGYRVATKTPVLVGDGEPLIFTGSIITESVNSAIEDNITGNYHEWNLLGNPYPSYIDVNLFLNHIGSVSGVSNLSLLNDNTAAIYGYDADDSDSSFWKITNLIEGPALIAPGQGFFVSSKNASAMLEFTTEMQVEGSSDDFILGRTSNETNYIKLKALSATNSASVSIYFHENGSTGLDKGYDAAVFDASVQEFSLFSHLVQDDQNIPMVIQTLNTDDIDNVIIPLSFNANQGQQIEFSLDDYNLPSSTEVYLEDRMNNSFTLLTLSNYAFTTNSIINGTGRFFLHFTTSSLSVEEIGLNSISIYANQKDRLVIIEGILLRDTEASLYDLLGREILQQKLNSATTTNTINTTTLSSGVYVVKLNNGSEQLTEKIILK